MGVNKVLLNMLADMVLIQAELNAFFDVMLVFIVISDTYYK